MCADCKPIKISSDTHGKVLRVLGEMQQGTDERMTMEKTILGLIDHWNGKKVRKE